MPNPISIVSRGNNFLLWYDNGANYQAFKTNGNLWYVELGLGTLQMFGDQIVMHTTNTGIHKFYKTTHDGHWVCKAGLIGNRFVWPFNPAKYPAGTVSDDWNDHVARGSAGGIDFGYPPAASGVAIPVVGAGTVTDTGFNSGDGNYCQVDHGSVSGHHLETRYLHQIAGSPIVTIGQVVIQSQTLGYIGNTGISTGAHLHLSTYDNGVNVDPYIWFANYEHW